MISIEAFSILIIFILIIFEGILMKLIYKDFDGSGFGIFGYLLFKKN